MQISGGVDTGESRKEIVNESIIPKSFGNSFEFYSKIISFRDYIGS